tara:strand:- start:725 stop:964 length:240 start_codon:yes stop_codon:yes gene_type:complete
MNNQNNVNDRAPFGFAWQDGELIEVEAEQAILNTISLLKESGLSYAQIKRQLVARGIHITNKADRIHNKDGGANHGPTR